MNTPIYIYDLNNYRVSPDGEPIFWVGESGRFIGFDEMDYDIKIGHWYITAETEFERDIRLMTEFAQQQDEEMRQYAITHGMGENLYDE